MSVKILHVLCEGQTEQGFVENVLKPYLLANGYAAVKSILVTIAQPILFHKLLSRERFFSSATLSGLLILNTSSLTSNTFSIRI